jgi:hypothetical protein
MNRLIFQSFYEKILKMASKLKPFSYTLVLLRHKEI